MLKRGTPKRSLKPPAPGADGAPNVGTSNVDGIRDGEWGNGAFWNEWVDWLLVMGREGAVVGGAVDKVGAVDEGLASVVDP